MSLLRDPYVPFEIKTTVGELPEQGRPMSERYIAVETEYINDWIVVDLRYRWKKDVTASAKIVTPVMREHDAKLLAAAKNAQEQGRWQ